MAGLEDTTAHPGEEWRAVVGYPDYSISSLGRVRRDTPGRLRKAVVGRILKPSPNPYGYLTVSLCLGSIVRTKPIHRLVVLAFLGPSPEGKPHANHIDGVKTNNRLDNLEYCSPAENQQHAARLGLLASGDRSGARMHPESRPRGESHWASKLRADDVREIRKLGPEWSSRKLAARFGVNRSTIKAIRRRAIWVHVD